MIGVSVKGGPDTCEWRMRMGKCGWENADRKMRMEKKARITKTLRKKKREMRITTKKKE